jgi:hypothetical protein
MRRKRERRSLLRSEAGRGLRGIAGGEQAEGAAAAAAAMMPHVVEGSLALMQRGGPRVPAGRCWFGHPPPPPPLA